jgi:hypothetical protein
MTCEEGNMKTKTEVWQFFNAAKVLAVQMQFTEEQCLVLKKECDDLFYQATGCPVCPAWWIGGWR